MTAYVLAANLPCILAQRYNRFTFDAWLAFGVLLPPAHEPTRTKARPHPRRPRYLIHLFCAHDESNDACPTSPAYSPGLPASGSVPALASVVFTDECELIETINPLVVPTSETFSATLRAPRALLISSISAPGKRRIGWRG
ncbi:MAG: hypothetical protein JWQ49_1970 [Edaphobacter sp.]|nr:hypothetical protein [Edaphobacter sp.]